MLSNSQCGVRKEDAMCCLQEYNMSKRLEHSFKSLSHDGSSISAVNPKAYAHRFQEFMSKVFS